MFGIIRDNIASIFTQTQLVASYFFKQCPVFRPKSWFQLESTSNLILWWIITIWPRLAEAKADTMQQSSGPMRIYSVGQDKECDGDANDEDGNAEQVVNYYNVF